MSHKKTTGKRIAWRCRWSCMPDTDGGIVFAESRSKAKYISYLGCSDVFPCKITEFEARRASHFDVLVEHPECQRIRAYSTEQMYSLLNRWQTEQYKQKKDSIDV